MIFPSSITKIYLSTASGFTSPIALLVRCHLSAVKDNETPTDGQTGPLKLSNEGNYTFAGKSSEAVGSDKVSDEEMTWMSRYDCHA